jgi:hypothetical protein
MSENVKEITIESYSGYFSRIKFEDKQYLLPGFHIKSTILILLIQMTLKTKKISSGITKPHQKILPRYLMLCVALAFTIVKKIMVMCLMLAVIRSQ